MDPGPPISRPLSARNPCRLSASCIHAGIFTQDRFPVAERLAIPPTAKPSPSANEQETGFFFPSLPLFSPLWKDQMNPYRQITCRCLGAKLDLFHGRDTGGCSKTSKTSTEAKPFVRGRRDSDRHPCRHLYMQPQASERGFPAGMRQCLSDARLHHLSVVFFLPFLRLAGTWQMSLFMSVAMGSRRSLSNSLAQHTGGLGLVNSKDPRPGAYPGHGKCGYQGSS